MKLLYLALPGAVWWAQTAASVQSPEALVVNDDPQKPLRLVLTRPGYRNTLFASRPLDSVRVEVYPSVHINPGLLVGSRLDLQIVDEAGRVLASNSVTNPGLTFLIRAEVDVRELPPGEFRLVARMFDSAGRPLSSVKGRECVDSLPLRKLPPAPHEVVFNDRGLCYVDGQPFFPIGIYHIWPGVFHYMNSVRREKGQAPLSWEGWFTKLRETGFNSFNDWQGGREPEELRARYDIAERLGFRGQVHPTEERDLTTLAGHGGVLGWYTWDEPMLHGVTEEQLEARYERYRALDPYHPQLACDNQPTSLERIAPYADVVMPDLYPQHRGDLRIVGRATAHARQLRGGRMPVWPIIQAFQISRYTTKADGSPYAFGRLDAEEMRCVVYDALACGATGIYYYAYYTSEGPQDLPDGSTRKDYLVDDFPDQWEAMRRINHELAEITPAILSGRPLPTSVEPRDSDVHAATFVEGERALLIVANPSRQEQAVEIGVPGLGDQEGADLFSPAAATSRRSWIALRLEPLAARAFAFPCGPPL